MQESKESSRWLHLMTTVTTRVREWSWDQVLLDNIAQKVLGLSVATLGTSVLSVFKAISFLQGTVIFLSLCAVVGSSLVLRRAARDTRRAQSKQPLERRVAEVVQWFHKLESDKPFIPKDDAYSWIDTAATLSTLMGYSGLLETEHLMDLVANDSTERALQTGVNQLQNALAKFLSD